jgi:hypothetical protein
MTTAGGENTALDDLKQAIASGDLSDRLQKQAKALAAQAEMPVRMSVLGLPNSGKSQLINLLAGSVLLPPGTKLPAVQLTFGDSPQADCTLSDGSIETIASGDLGEAARLGPVFVDARYPLPALRKLSFLEVAAGPSFEEQKRAMMWAAKRTDMAVWCTEAEFGSQEEDLLSLMPERVQDNAFLVMTKADLLQANGRLPQVLATLQSASREFFDKVYPLDAPSALAARKPDGTVDKDAMRDSGAIALISAIKRVVDRGQQAMLDQAELFLRQVEAKPAKPAPSRAKAQPAEADAKTAPEEAKTSEPSSLLPASREACQVAISQLKAEGAFMADALAQDELPPETVLDTCADTIIWLSEYLADSGAQDDPVMVRARAAAVDGADLIQLVQLETGDGVSADALSILVQLKHEIEGALAA